MSNEIRDLNKTGYLSIPFQKETLLASIENERRLHRGLFNIQMSDRNVGLLLEPPLEATSTSSALDVVNLVNGY
jgi:hypothetical protein